MKKVNLYIDTKVLDNDMIEFYGNNKDKYNWIFIREEQDEENIKFLSDIDTYELLNRKDERLIGFKPTYQIVLSYDPDQLLNFRSDAYLLGDITKASESIEFLRQELIGMFGETGNSKTIHICSAK